MNNKTNLCALTVWKKSSLVFNKYLFYYFRSIQSSPDEVDDATTSITKNQDFRERKYEDKTKRKLGVFLSGAAAGSITAGLWSYSDLKNEDTSPDKPLGLLQAAQVINKISDAGKPNTPTRRDR